MPKQSQRKSRTSSGVRQARKEKNRLANEEARKRNNTRGYTTKQLIFATKLRVKYGKNAPDWARNIYEDYFWGSHQ